jgi:uncharacterized protein (UPF0261 family)
MQIIAVVACFDTKYHEIKFVKNRIEALGCKPFLCDISTGPSVNLTDLVPDMTREDILDCAGISLQELKSMDKGTAIVSMADSAQKAIKKLFEDGKFDGIIGMGGLQNTIICSKAFQCLPLGFPKTICSTIACGNRTFDTVVGDKDIAVLPSIVDFAGVNPINKVVLSNTVAMVVGMVQYGQHAVETNGEQYIGATLMGITNDTVMRAINDLSDKGKHVISFHSTGIGGRVMENLIRDGVITATMDLCLHEMTAEYFGGKGYSRGANNRLCAASEMGIPQLVCPGGIDFICLEKQDFFEDEEERGYVWHTKNYLTHTRLWESEILDITKTIISRLNKAKGPVEVVLPMGGLRTLSRPGEFFYKPDTIMKMRKLFENGLDHRIKFKAYDLNFDDAEFGDVCATEMMTLLNKKE